MGAGLVDVLIYMYAGRARLAGSFERIHGSSTSKISVMQASGSTKLALALTLQNPEGPHTKLLWTQAPKAKIVMVFRP